MPTSTPPAGRGVAKRTPAQDFSGLRVAITHSWLVTMRGGEKVVEQLLEVFPQAEIFTLVYDPSKVSETIRNRNVHVSWLGRIPFATRIYQSLFGLMPEAVERFDMSGFDLVISDETCVAKGVLTQPETLHVCYCCTPARYAWDLYQEYLRGLSFLKRWYFRRVAHRFRVWDVAAAQRVDHFVSISEHIAKRVRKHYRRESTVVFPPVDTGAFRPNGKPGEFFLVLGQLVVYKRADLAVRAFNENGLPLVVIGDGAQYKLLKRIAKPNVRILGRQSFEVIQDHYARCRAFVFPGEEDFGITPLEAQAAGRPVIAYAKGGALETVVDGKTGLFFDEQTPESLNAAVTRFLAAESRFKPSACVAQAARFSNETFRARITAVVARELAAHRRAFPGRV